MISFSLSSSRLLIWCLSWLFVLTMSVIASLCTCWQSFFSPSRLASYSIVAMIPSAEPSLERRFADLSDTAPLNLFISSFSLVNIVIYSPIYSIRCPILRISYSFWATLPSYEASYDSLACFCCCNCTLCYSNSFRSVLITCIWVSSYSHRSKHLFKSCSLALTIPSEAVSCDSKLAFSR